MGEIGEHFRDVKAHRKQQKLGNPPRRRCWDWMIVSGDCHYAKNRSSFRTYRRFQGTAQGATVIGIGTVELEVRRSPTKGSGTHTLVLKNVLHIPGALCNGFCPMLLDGAQSWSRGFVQGFDSNDRSAYYGEEFCGLRRVVLAGNPQGESVLKEKKQEGSHFMLSVYLTAEEQANLRAA